MLVSSSKATFSNAGSSPPLVFHPSDPPAEKKLALFHFVPLRVPTLSSLVLREFTSDFIKLGAIAKLLQGFFFLGVFFALDIIRMSDLTTLPYPQDLAVYRPAPEL